jgi:hypothetical protein
MMACATVNRIVFIPGLLVALLGSKRKLSRPCA